MEGEVQQQRYKDNVTIVTGGTSGIGEGCVRLFVKHGSKVVFCAKEVDGGIGLADELNTSGPGQALYVQCDMTREADIQRLIDTTVKEFGQIDCLINNVGWHPPRVLIDDITMDDFRSLFELNVLSCFLASKFALPHLRKTRGNIINASSMVATFGQEGAASYCATKGAIRSFTRALAVDEASNHVRVNAFSPSNVWTPLWDEAAKGRGNPDEFIAEGKNAQLMGRFGTTEECAQLCLYLAAEATFTTGVDIPISGGAELNYGNKNRLLKT